MSGRPRQSATERREQFEERAEIQRRRRLGGRYFDLGSLEKIRVAAEIAAAEHQPRRMETPSQP